MALRRDLSVNALEDLLSFLKNGGQVGIFDATNTTRERRENILKTCNLSKDRILFIESICNDGSIIKKNIKDIKVKSDDYLNTNKDEASKDFEKRIHEYEKVYQTLDESHDESLSFIKLFDVRKRIVLNRIQGYLPFRCVSLLMNNNIHPRKIFLSRHGESLYNTVEKLGGDSDLSDRGKAYAKVLFEFINKQPESKKMSIWTSTLKRTIRTAQHFDQTKVINFKQLDEIDAGLCDGLTYKQIEKEMPNEWKERQKDKFRYRYPRGESYRDIVTRVEPVILEMEAQTDSVLILTHQAITRVFYAYLLGKKPEQCCNIEVPLHTVIEITPGPYTTTEFRYDLNSFVEEELKKNKH